MQEIKEHIIKRITSVSDQWETDPFPHIVIDNFLPKNLFDKIKNEAKQKNYNFIHLRCRENLEANKFWKALNFDFLKLEHKKTKRTDLGVNHWVYKINHPKQYLLL